MVLFTYEKKGAAAFIPHLDVLRAVVRTIRRAGLDVKYSEGFNPHMLLYFSPPIPVGVASEAVQCAAVTEEGPSDFMERYNAVAVHGLKILSAGYALKSNPAAEIKAAEYEISFPGADALPFDAMLKEKTLNARFTDKDGRETVKDIRGGILSVRAAGRDTLRCILSAGNENVRADRFAAALTGYAGLTVPQNKIMITRKKLYNRMP